MDTVRGEMSTPVHRNGSTDTKSHSASMFFLWYTDASNTEFPAGSRFNQSNRPVDLDFKTHLYTEMAYSFSVV